MIIFSKTGKTQAKVLKNVSKKLAVAVTDEIDIVGSHYFRNYRLLKTNP